MASECWMCDLDGVMWLGNNPIPGSSAAIARLRASGRRVCFFTNNSFSSRAELHAKFADHSIDCDDEDLFSSGEAASFLMEPGERAFVLGGAGIHEALTGRGVEVLDVAAVEKGATADAVVVGLDPKLEFARLTAATRSVHRGARLIGTNDDATYPTPDGPLPGGGSLLAAVSYATGVTAEVAGKPYQPAADLVARRLGTVAVMVGDRPETDGLFAKRLAARYALVRSGVVASGVTVDNPVPDLDAPDLASLVDGVLAADG